MPNEEAKLVGLRRACRPVDIAARLKMTEMDLKITGSVRVAIVGRGGDMDWLWVWVWGDF